MGGTDHPRQEGKLSLPTNPFILSYLLYFSIHHVYYFVGHYCLKNYYFGVIRIQEVYLVLIEGLGLMCQFIVTTKGDAAIIIVSFIVWTLGCDQR